MKKRLRPTLWDESVRFRGATHVQRDGPALSSFWCGKGTAPVSGPAGGAVSPDPCRGTLPAVVCLSVRRCAGYLLRHSGVLIRSRFYPNHGKKSTAGNGDVSLAISPFRW